LRLGSAHGPERFERDASVGALHVRHACGSTAIELIHPSGDLGISPRQVERHLEQARRRAKAATTAQLVAMLVSGRLAPASQAPASTPA